MTELFDNTFELLPPEEGFENLHQEEDNNPKDVDKKEEKETMFFVNEDFSVETREVDGEEEEEEIEEKEPAKPDTKKTVKQETTKNPKEVQDSEFYTALGSSLKEWGVLSEFEAGEDVTLDSLKEAFEKEKKAFAEQYFESKLGNLTPRQKQILNIDSREADDEVVTISDTLAQLKEIDPSDLETDKELAKNIYAFRLKQAGLSDAKIKKYIDLAEEKDSLAEEAEESLQELIELNTNNLESAKQRAKDREIAAAKQREERVQKLKDAVFKVKEFIPGIEVNDKIKQAVYDSITKTVEKGPNGPVNKIGQLANSNPDGFQALLHYYATIGLFNQDKDGQFVPDLSKIKTVAKSKVIQNLDNESKLRRGLFSPGASFDEPTEGESLIERMRRNKHNK